MNAIRLWALAIATVLSLSAQAQQPAPPVATDPAFETARAAFEALPESDRRTIQESLVWTGLYNGTTAGGFGRRTYDAIGTFQKQAGAKPDGILDPKARAALAQAAGRARDAIGFKLVADPRTKVRIGIPQKILSKTEPVAATGGTRWQSADGKITLDARGYAPAESDLPQLFERLTSQVVPGRKVTYKLLRPDFLVVSGETATGKFFIRYAAGPEGVRGFTLGYDKAQAASFDKIVIAMTNSFEAYPGTATASAAITPTPPPPRPPTARGPLATGLVLDGKRILTTSAVEACGDLLVAGTKARILDSDREARLVILESERSLPSAPVTIAAASEGMPAILLSFGASGGQPASLVVAPGEIVAGSRVSGALQPGGAGAPVFDRAGALVGIVTSYPEAPRQIAGIVPPASYPMSEPAAFERFAAKAGLNRASGPAAAPNSAGALVARLAPSTVAITCAR